MTSICCGVPPSKLASAMARYAWKGEVCVCVCVFASCGWFLLWKVRRLCWPLLVKLHPLEGHLRGGNDHHDERKMSRRSLHGAETQVEKDVERSMYLVDKAHRVAMRGELKHIMNRVLAGGKDQLWYYQGYHDVVTTFLLVCRSTQLTESVVDRVSFSHLRPMLAKDLKEVVALLDKLFPIVAQEDSQVHAFLQQSFVQPYFALPWVLTWFSHSVANFETVCRLFDIFLASDPSMPLFVATATVLWTKPHLLRVQCEYSAVHSFFSKLFSDISMRLNVEDDSEMALGQVPLAKLFDEDLEHILAHAVRLHGKWSRRFVPSHEPFAPNASLQQYPMVRMTELPPSARKPIVAFQYRFEGVRKKRGAQRRKYAVLVSAGVVALTLVLGLLLMRVR